MNRINILIKLIPILFIGISLQAQVNTKVNLNFENKVQAWLEDLNVPAVGVGLIENGQIKCVKVLGELRKNVPARDDAIFAIASVTKPVVSMITFKLVESGEWDLDEQLYKYWIDPDIEDDSTYKKLTTRHVLSHQSGFPNWRTDLESKKLEFLFEPGTKYNYSGEGFEYLRRALENKFGKTLEQISDSVLFNPLKMTDTNYRWQDEIDESRFGFHT